MSDSTRRDIELRIRATNLSNQEFAKVSQSIQHLARDIDAEVQAAGRGKLATDELRSSMSRLEQQANALRNLAVLVDRFKNLEGNLRASQAQFDSASQKLAAYRAHLDTLDKTTKEHERSLKNFVSAVTSAEKALEKNKTQLSGVDAELKRLGVDTKNLVETENQLKVSSDSVGASMTKLNDALLNNAKNVRQAKEETKQLADEQKKAADAQKQVATSLEAGQSFRTRRLAQIHAEIDAEENARKAKLKQVEDSLAAAKKEDEARQKFVMQARRDTDRYVTGEKAKEKAETDRINKSIQEHNAWVAKVREIERNRERESNAIRDREDRNRATMAVRGTTTAPVGGVGGLDPRSREAQRVGILSPYQWQQLSFQINDVFTQLASGTSLTQTLAQQGGQIAQLFASTIGQMLRFLPQVAAAGAALAVVIGTLNRAFSDRASIREFNALLSINADGARFNAIQITTLRREVQNLGMSWEDTGTVMKTAIAAGFRADVLKDFATAVQNVVDVTGEKAPDAAKKLADAFTGGWESLRRFNQETNFLLPAQYEQIRSLFQSGQAAEGAAKAWAIYRGQVKEAADGAVSPFTKLTRELSAAWRELLATLANSDAVQTIVRAFVSITDSLTESIRRLDELKAKFEGSWLQKFIEFNARYSPPALAWRGMRALTGPAAPLTTADVPAAVAGQERVKVQSGAKLDTADTQALLAVIREASKNLPEGVSGVEITSGRVGRASGTRNHPEGHAVDMKLIDENGRTVPGFMGVDVTGKYTAFAVVAKGVVRTMYPNRVAEFESGTRYGDQDAGHLGFRAGGARGSRGPIPDATTLREQDTARATNAQSELNKETQKTLDLDKTANRELILKRKEQEEIARIQNDPKFKGASDDVVKAEAARLVTLERIKLERQDRAEDAKERTQRITDGSHYAEIRAAGETAYQAAVTRGEQNREELQKIRQDAESEHRAKMSRTEKERNDLETLQNTLNGLARQNELKNVSDIEAKVKSVTTQYERLGQLINKFSREFPNVDVTKIREQAAANQGEAEQRTGAEARMQQLIALQTTRNDLMSTYNTLLEKGLMTQTEFEEKSRALFERTGGEIRKTAEETEKWLATTDKIDATKLELYNAKIKEIKANSEFISPLWKKVKETIEESFTTGLATAFNTVAEAVGGLIAKTKSWGDVLNSVKQAAANFFAQLLRDIAMAILKYEALKLVSSITGGGGGSLFGTVANAATGTGAAAATSTTGAAASSGFSIFGLKLFHGGGVAGHGGAFGYGNPAWFANAPRYHRGAVAGLGPDEQAAIIRRNEEVLTEDNPRHIFNAGSQEINIRSVLVDDPTRIPAAMQSVAGERAIMAAVVKNMATIRQGVK